MKFIKQFGIIMLISFLGEILKGIIPLSIPSSIYGLLIMLLLLKLNILPLESVREAGNFLIEIMPLMFIPAGVGLITSWNELRKILIPIIIITILTTIVVMGITGRITQFMVKNKKRKSFKYKATQ